MKELVRFFKYRMIDNDFPGVGIYNCTFEPAYNIEQICENHAGYYWYEALYSAGSRWTADDSSNDSWTDWWKKVGIHPARVKKLMGEYKYLWQEVGCKRI